MPICRIGKGSLIGDSRPRILLTTTASISTSTILTASIHPPVCPRPEYRGITRRCGRQPPKVKGRLRKVVDLHPVWVLAHRSVGDRRQHPGFLVDRIAGHRVRYLADREQVAPARVDRKAARLRLGWGMRDQGQRARLDIDAVAG